MAGTREDETFLSAAFEQARKSYDEGGVPIGAALVDSGGRILGCGHNQRVQKGSAILHGEMDCLEKAGRRPGYAGTTLYTTLSPCMMCAGTVVQFGIPRVVIADAETFAGNADFLRERGVDVAVMPYQPAIELMRRFVAENPTLWHEDIAEPSGEPE